MSQVKPFTVLLIVLTVIFAASTGYLLTNPNTMTETVTQAVTLSSTVVSNVNSPLYSVNIAYKNGIGFYLTNATGWTLYFLKTDIPSNGTSTCTGKCINNWPAFYIETEMLNLPTGLNSTSFGEITRPDGGKQTTYNGWPLYYFIKDTKPGDTNGQGINKVWFVYSLPALSALSVSVFTSTTTTSTTPDKPSGMGY
jgi:predicted lipoprotein with Yx(FWY)xxD motif